MNSSGDDRAHAAIPNRRIFAGTTCCDPAQLMILDMRIMPGMKSPLEIARRVLSRRASCVPSVRIRELRYEKGSRLVAGGLPCYGRSIPGSVAHRAAVQ